MLLSDVEEATIIAADREAEVAKIRAERLELAELELLDRLEKARDAASRDAIDKERQAAEEKVAAGVKALAEYVTLAERIRDIITIVEAVERAAETFNRNHSDEPQLDGPEFRAASYPPRRARSSRRSASNCGSTTLLARSFPKSASSKSSSMAQLAVRSLRRSRRAARP